MNTVFASKFIVILKTLSEEELKTFEIWLKSPWCNSNKNLIRLFERIKKYYPQFDNQKLTKEKLFQQILPNGKFSHRRMNNLFSEGYLAAEKFIVLQNLSRNENLQKDLLTKEFQKRHLDDWFFRDGNKEINRLENKIVKDWEDHLDLLRLHRRIYHHPYQNSRMQPGGATIVKMGEQLDLVYLLEKAAIINEKIFRNRILKNENHEVEEELKKWKVASEGIEHPAIHLYTIRFSYTEENMIAKYADLRDDFFKTYTELNDKDQRIHLLSLSNDVNYLLRKNLLQLEEVLNIYKFGFLSKILPIDGNLTGITYSSVISISNSLKDFDYSEKFIKLNTDFLSPEVKGDARSWAIAHTAYRKGKLEDSLNILLTKNFKVFYFELLSKVLNLQVYFDLYLKDDSYQEYLFDFCNAFEKKILREKLLSQVKKESLSRFIQRSRELVKLSSEIELNEEKLKTFLTREKNIEARSWLLQKRDEILNTAKK